MDAKRRGLRVIFPANLRATTLITTCSPRTFVIITRSFSSLRDSCGYFVPLFVFLHFCRGVIFTVVEITSTPNAHYTVDYTREHSRVFD